MQKNHLDENKVVTKMKQLKFVLLSTLCQACAELWATKESKKYKLKINNQIVLIKKMCINQVQILQNKVRSNSNFSRKEKKKQKKKISN